MTHMYIKLCDICGKACEIDSGLHGGTISADIIVKEGKASKVAFREGFDVCITCLRTVGLLDILEKMKKMKDENESKPIEFKKLLEEKGAIYK